MEMAIARNPNYNPVNSLFRGAMAHFRLRYGSWVASGILFGMGLVMMQNQGLFENDPHADTYAYLTRLASQDFWLYVMLLLGGGRLFALIINGTFPTFTLSPHIRAACSFLSCFVWFQLIFGAFSLPHWNFAAPVYVGLFILDVVNTYIATLEIDRPEGE
jgi:hypothetical protein